MHVLYYLFFSSYLFLDEHEGTQKKTFTKWINAQLAKVHYKHSDYVCSIVTCCFLAVVFVLLSWEAGYLNIKCVISYIISVIAGFYF